MNIFFVVFYNKCEQIERNILLCFLIFNNLIIWLEFGTILCIFVSTIDTCTYNIEHTVDRNGKMIITLRRVNVGCGPAEERVLLTGLHAVADIYCECCKTTLGWKYVSYPLT